MSRNIVNAIEATEKELGIRIPEDVWMEVLIYSHQKLESIKKPMDYLPVLFQSELADFYARLEINLKGVANNVQRMLANPLSSSVS